MISARKVTKWFIKENPYLASGFIDENTKVNKLLYFANLFSYAVYKEPMISDTFVAFPNGPVVFDIYRDYKYNGLNHYPTKEIKIDDKYLKILQIVNFVYGNKEKNELVDLSHSHNLWQDVKEQIPNNPKINFNKADKDLLEKCRKIFETYNTMDFDNIKKEVINGNVYYYRKDDIDTLSDEMIHELMNYAKDDEAHFIEVWDGELVLL